MGPEENARNTMDCTKPNDEVLRKANVKWELLKIRKSRKIAYLGHFLRGDEYNILQLVSEGKIEC